MKARIPIEVADWPYPLRLAEATDVYDGASLFLINLDTGEERYIRLQAGDAGQLSWHDKVTGEPLGTDDAGALLGFMWDGFPHGLFIRDESLAGRTPNGVMCSECGEFIPRGKIGDVCAGHI